MVRGANVQYTHLIFNATPPISTSVPKTPVSGEILVSVDENVVARMLSGFIVSEISAIAPYSG
jgi:hypothetical protein